MFIAYPLLSRLLQAYQNTHRVLTNYQESDILPSDIRHSIPRKCDENIFGRSSDSFPIHTPSRQIGAVAKVLVRIVWLELTAAGLFGTFTRFPIIP